MSFETDRPLNARQATAFLIAIAGLGLTLLFGRPALGQQRPLTELGDSPPAALLRWHTDYALARSTATERRTLLLVQFHASGSDEGAAKAWRDSLATCTSRLEKLSQWTLASVATDSRIQVNNESIQLSDHSAFAELLGGPGLAVIDCRDAASEAFRSVISLIPCLEARAEGGIRFPSPTEVDVLLDLPEGSLTQRTLVYAVRTHPDGPRSAAGEWHPALVTEVQSHSAHQASIRVQGHHGWESRFHRINTQLPGDVVAQEVCAESWPAQGLWAAARECVRSWRQSSGHWNAVSTSHPYFAYDMKRGANGVWYATGIFGRRR